MKMTPERQEQSLCYNKYLDVQVILRMFFLKKKQHKIIEKSLHTMVL